MTPALTASEYVRWRWRELAEFFKGRYGRLWVSRVASQCQRSHHTLARVESGTHPPTLTLLDAVEPVAARLGFVPMPPHATPRERKMARRVSAVLGELDNTVRLTSRPRPAVADPGPKAPSELGHFVPLLSEIFPITFYGEKWSRKVSDVIPRTYHQKLGVDTRTINPPLSVPERTRIVDMLLQQRLAEVTQDDLPKVKQYPKRRSVAVQVRAGKAYEISLSGDDISWAGGVEGGPPGGGVSLSGSSATKEPSRGERMPDYLKDLVRLHITDPSSADAPCGWARQRAWYQAITKCFDAMVVDTNISRKRRELAVDAIYGYIEKAREETIRNPIPPSKLASDKARQYAEKRKKKSGDAAPPQGQVTLEAPDVGPS